MFFKRKYKRNRASVKIAGSKFLPIFLLIFILMTYGFSNSYNKSWNFDWSGIRPQVKDSILALKRFGSISTGVGGNGRKETSQFNRQLWLIKNVTNSEFLKLTDYPNGIVKGLSYRVLLNRNPKAKYSLFKKSLNDTLSFVYVQTGCIESGFMLNEYLGIFSDRNNPKSNYSHLKEDLTDAEFLELKALFVDRKNKEEMYKDLYRESIK